jgi:hypothetical protein
MNTVACPFKPVVQRERLDPEPHVHRFELEILTDDPSLWVQDCACGYRQRVRKVGVHVTEVLNDGLVEGGGSIQNGVFYMNDTMQWQDRWSLSTSVTS